MIVEYINEKFNSKSMTVFTFPGQGSQSVGMGRELFDYYPDLVKVADRILGYSIEELCLSDPLNIISNTRFAQPAIFIVNALSFMKALEDGSREPDFLLGFSLGEYNALHAAGVIDFETGLNVVKKRGELMSKVHGGSMAAVLGMSEERINRILNDSGMGQSVVIANYNTPEQNVLSGPVADINALKEVFEAEGGRYSILRVSGAFHSKYMSGVQKEYGTFLNTVQFKPSKIPVISNFTAREYVDGQERELLLEQLVHSVKWTESVRYLMGKGTSEFIQIGPGMVINRLIKTITETCLPIDEKEAPCLLGSKDFREEFGVNYSYIVGGMSHGITSCEMIKRLSDKKILGFLGSDGVEIKRLEADIRRLQSEGANRFGVNVVYPITKPAMEQTYFKIIHNYRIPVVEISSYMNQTLALVEYRLKGLTKSDDNTIRCKNHLLVKTFQPEIAKKFCDPPSEKLVKKLLEEHRITTEEAYLSKEISLASGIIIETGRDADIGLSHLLAKQFKLIKEQSSKEFCTKNHVYIGCAGGLGTPEAIACAFWFGFDFVETGSINQCTVESAISDTAKDILSKTNILDTVSIPSEQLFEWGGKSRAVKKGSFFPYRANKLYELYIQYDNITNLPATIRNQLENSFFGKTLIAVAIEAYGITEEAEKRISERDTMVAVFKKYFEYALKWTIDGNEQFRSSYCIYGSPAVGAFNEWAADTELSDWRIRHADTIAERLMKDAKELI